MAGEDGHYALMVRVYETLLTGLAPSGALSWFSADAGRALYALDRADLARLWIDALRREAGRDPVAGVAADTLWVIASLAELAADQGTGIMARETRSVPATAPVESPLAVGAAPQPAGRTHVSVLPMLSAVQPAPVDFKDAKVEIRADMPGAEAWRMALRTIEPETAAHRIADAYTLLAAAGAVIGDAEWRALLGDSEGRMAVTPDPASRAMMLRAANQGRRGETVMLAALILGESGLADMDMAVLAEIVSALRQVGLGQEARRFALEIAVQAGI